jgi:hypothetical protein
VPEAFEFVAWLGNTELPVDDEDHEWCAVFVVLADSAELAARWGDTITRGFCSESSDLFLRSSVEPHVCGMAIKEGQKHPCPTYPALSQPGNEALAMPVVVYGEPASAEYIGW